VHVLPLMARHAEQHQVVQMVRGGIVLVVWSQVVHLKPTVILAAVPTPAAISL
jgi:hypothetical protein